MKKEKDTKRGANNEITKNKHSRNKQRLAILEKQTKQKCMDYDYNTNNKHSNHNKQNNNDNKHNTNNNELLNSSNNCIPRKRG